jgi:dihydrofolate reductase
MRRLRYSVGMSLDGYIAGPKGEADWLFMDPEIDFGAMLSEYDTLLMGRKTYEAAQAMGGGGGGMFPGMKVVVVSRTLKPKAHPKVAIVSGDLKEAVGALKAQPGRDIWLFGGGELFRGCLAQGLVDDVEVGLIPILLGGGIPLLLPPADRAPLRLSNHRVFGKTGTVMLRYEVVPPAPAGKSRGRKPSSGRASRSRNPQP